MGTAGRPTATRPKRGFSGSTAKAYGSAILGAPFWKPDLEIAGIYIGSFDTAAGVCFKFKCAVPAKLTVYTDEAGRVVPQEDGKPREIDQFAIGSLAGFQMACDDMTANGWTGFRMHDRVWIKCTSEQEPTQAGYSPMLMFDVMVEG